jgi:hypothetical protein
VKQSFVRRVWKAAILHADTYEEVEADKSAIGQALVVVTLAALAGGAGSWLLHAVHRGLPPSVAILPTALEVLEPFVLWVGGSFFSYTLGATFFRGVHTETDFAEVLRTVGFAFGVGILRFVGFALPPLQAVLGLGDSEIPRILFNTVLELWVLVAGIVAVRQALDFDTRRAVGTYGSAYVLLYLVVMGLSTAIG